VPRRAVVDDAGRGRRGGRALEARARLERLVRGRHAGRRRRRKAAGACVDRRLLERAILLLDRAELLLERRGAPLAERDGARGAEEGEEREA